MSANSPIFSANEMAFAYNTTPVLKDCTFDIPRGAFVLVKGPSGGGKSTLLRLLARLEAAGSGELRFDGTPFPEIPPHEYRLRTGYMHQKPVIASGSVRDNLALAFAWRNGATMPQDEELRDDLARLNLSDVALDQSAAELSVGQQQRVAFLRLALFDSEVMLLDEPLASLDDDSAGRVMGWLKEGNAAGKTILMSAHGNNFRQNEGMSLLRIENSTARYEA